MTYTCQVCNAINHAKRLRCQFCGAVPAMYRIANAPETVAAIGCDRQENHHTTRVNLRTVPLDYYAQGE